MLLKIINVMDATSNEWDTFWNSSNSATYYHSREWAEVWQSYTNGNIYPEPKIITFSDDKKVVLPVLRQKYYKGTIKRYALTGPPFISKYGNWLNRDILGKNHISLLISLIIKKYNNLVWQLNPFDEHTKYINIKSKYAKRIRHIAYVIDLTEGEYHIYANMKKNCRNAIKQGIKNKLVTKEADGKKDWLNYYDIYLDTIKRWGPKTPYILGWRLFEILYNMNSEYIKLWLTWYNDIPIAGCIAF